MHANKSGNTLNSGCGAKTSYREMETGIKPNNHNVTPTNRPRGAQ